MTKLVVLYAWKEPHFQTLLECAHAARKLGLLYTGPLVQNAAGEIAESVVYSTSESVQLLVDSSKISTKPVVISYGFLESHLQRRNYSYYRINYSYYPSSVEGNAMYWSSHVETTFWNAREEGVGEFVSRVLDLTLRDLKL